eukprot:Protomagalhaensia_sp_Gyna_25__490@NODE_1231_length_2042_cov_68_654518_g982_i0_p1_GENE_NODE_1231_length_2042_cov_68_654518_g982_i0NODE_1231_length_2042_cov_68_654518_g982_i0_p1_ORF_typecomplete_len631_score106_77ALMT/PF11744_8/1_7e11ArAE_2_N/PF10337_9/1_4e06_NODE_1231_length_2042_cov_68_654518_g982_i0561948
MALFIPHGSHLTDPFRLPGTNLNKVLDEARISHIVEQVTRIPELQPAGSTSLRARIWDWVQSNVPTTFDQNRAGLQLTVCLLITCTIFWFPSIFESTFGMSQAYIAVTACRVYESTYGGIMGKSLDRTLAILGAGLTALILLVPMYLAGVTVLSIVVKVTIVIYGILLAFLWGYVRIISKKSSLVLSGLGYSAAIFAMLTDGTNYLAAVGYVTACHAIGITTGTLVFRSVAPKSARDKAIRDLQKICIGLAKTMKPLVQLQAGLAESPSFFQKADRNSVLSRLSMTLARRFSRRFSHQPPNDKESAKESAPATAAEIQALHKSLGDQIQKVLTLLGAEPALVDSARKEVGRHRFPKLESLAFLDELRSLSYHIVSLCLALDSRVAAARDASVAALLGPSVVGAASTAESPAAPIMHRPPQVNNKRIWSIQVMPHKYEDEISDDGSESCYSFQPDVAIAVREAANRISLLQHAGSRPASHWTSAMGPAVAEMAGHAALAIALFSVYLKERVLPPALDAHIAMAEEALGELVRKRLRYTLTIQAICNTTVQQATPDPERVRRGLEIHFFRNWLGLSATEYAALPKTARAAFWEGLGAAQDRIAITTRVLMGLLVSLKKTRNALQTFVQAYNK